MPVVAEFVGFGRDRGWWQHGARKLEVGHGRPPVIGQSTRRAFHSRARNLSNFFLPFNEKQRLRILGM